MILETAGGGSTPLGISIVVVPVVELGNSIVVPVQIGHVAVVAGAAYYSSPSMATRN